MATKRTVAPAFVLALLVGIGGCQVGITSQRAALRHDAEADEVRLLLFYDGMHGEAGSGARRELEMLGEGGGLLLSLIHPGLLLQMGESEPDEVEQALIDHAERNVTLRTLGHYRGLDGRIGIVQALRIARASEWLQAVNARLNARIATMVPGGRPRTQQRFAEAAANDHAWLAFEGSALVIRIPIDEAEWPQVKQAWLDEAGRLGVQGLGQLVTGYEESDRWVTLRLGGRREAMTFYVSDDLTSADRPKVERVDLNDPEGEAAVEDERDRQRAFDEMVREFAPENVDSLLLAAGPDGADANDATVRDLLRWGPAEQYAAAVLASVEAGRLTDREAVGLLTRWAATEGERRGIPLPADDVLLLPDEIGRGEEGDRVMQRIFDEWRRWVRQTRFREETEAPAF